MDTIKLVVDPRLEPQLEAVRLRHNLPVDTPRGELVRLLICDQMQEKQGKVFEKHPEMKPPEPRPDPRIGRKLRPSHKAEVVKTLRTRTRGNLGRKFTEEHRRKLSESHKRRCAAFRYHHTIQLVNAEGEIFKGKLDELLKKHPELDRKTVLQLWHGHKRVPSHRGWRRISQPTRGPSEQASA